MSASALLLRFSLFLVCLCVFTFHSRSCLSCPPTPSLRPITSFVQENLPLQLLLLHSLAFLYMQSAFFHHWSDCTSCVNIPSVLVYLAFVSVCCSCPTQHCPTFSLNSCYMCHISVPSNQKCLPLTCTSRSA